MKREPVFRAKGRMARSEHIPCGSVSEEQRSQAAFCAKTLRAARLLPVAGVGSLLIPTCRDGDARNSPPWPRPKSAAAGPPLIFRQALRRKSVRVRRFAHDGRNKNDNGRQQVVPQKVAGHTENECGGVKPSPKQHKQCAEDVIGSADKGQHDNRESGANVIGQAGGVIRKSQNKRRKNQPHTNKNADPSKAQ